MEISIDVFSVVKVITIVFLIYITYIYTRQGCPIAHAKIGSAVSCIKEKEEDENLDNMISYYMKLQDEEIESLSE
jgi:hypothetical protein